MALPNTYLDTFPSVSFCIVTITDGLEVGFTASSDSGISAFFFWNHQESNSQYFVQEG